MSPSALEGKGQEKLDDWILAIVIKLRCFVGDIDNKMIPVPTLVREEKKTKSGPVKVFCKNTFIYVLFVCTCMPAVAH